MKTRVRCLKHESVLHLNTTNGPRVRFSRERDEDDDVPDTVYLRREMWEDMGRPETITMTVKPGDHLNVVTGPQA